MSRTEGLLAQLQVHVAVDELEAGHRQAMVNLLTSGADPFARTGFAPGHFTASCYVVDGQGRLLLHRHRRLGRWLQLGGHVEGEESPQAAALREGSEESGLVDLELIGGILDLDVHPIPAGKGEPDHAHFDVRYAARTSAPEAIAIDRSESDELAWVPLDRASAMMGGEESLRVIHKLERLLARGASR